MLAFGAEHEQNNDYHCLWWSFVKKMKKLFIFFLSFLANTSTFYFVDSISTNPLLLLISFDGFRWDFLNETLTPNIWALSTEGVRLSHGVLSQMVSTTAPNHYTIATGLYEESHGIVGNEFFDPKISEFYDLWNFSKIQSRYERSKMGFWYSGEPIWITNQKTGEGRLSGSMFWPSGDANISGILPKVFKTWADFGNLTVWKGEFDQVLQWFLRPLDPINLGLWYIGQPDHTEHESGTISSQETLAVVRDLDKLVGYMVSRLKAAGLYHRLNLILTADHGHAECAYPKNEIPMTDYVKDFPSLVRTSDGFSLTLNKSAGNSNIHEIFTKLRAKLEADFKNGEVSVMRKMDFPNFRYHWTNTARIGEILVIPKMGYHLNYNLTRAELSKEPNKTISHHGYYPDLEKMRAFLVFHGPAFKKDFLLKSDSVQNVDLYPLMCRILKLTPAPNNGSLDRITVVLLNDAQDTVSVLKNLLTDNKIRVVIIFAMVLPGVFFLCYMLACIMTRQSSAAGLEKKIKGGNSKGYRRLANTPGGSANSLNGSTTEAKFSLANGKREKPLLLLGQENLDSMSENEL